MEKVRNRIESLQDALTRLDESIDAIKQENALMFYTQLRDSIIQRLEFCVDLFWKCLKDFLQQKHGIKAASPKSCIREVFNLDIIDQDQYKTLLKMVEDRNDTSHRYDEGMAEDISKSAPKYSDLMEEVLKRLK